MQKEYFIADTHFFHNNILEFEDRDFDTVEDMNAFIIKRWNEQVAKDDIVWHIGDFSISNYGKAKEIFEQLNGKINLIGGNHDKTTYCQRWLEEGLINAYYPVGHVMKFAKHRVWLTHYPMEIGVRTYKWSLHGHIHSEPSSAINQINVGMDSPLNLVIGKQFGDLITKEDLIMYMDATTETIKAIIEKEGLRQK